MRETLLYPLEAIRLHEVLARYSDWLYFTLVLIFFISLAGLALRRHFQRPYVKPLIVAVGLLLTIAVFKNRQILEAIFNGWGALGTILLICVAAIIPLGLARGFGLPSSKAAWLIYVLFYLIAWAHYPQLFEMLNRSGLGIVSLALLVLFLVGIWKVVRPRLGNTARVETGSLESWTKEPRPQVPEIKQEAEQQVMEAKATARQALPLTINELQTVEDMEKALKQVEQLIAARGQYLDRQDREQIAQLLGKALGRERLFKSNLVRLAKILQHLRVMSVKELGEMRARLGKASGQDKKLLKAELEKEREKTVIFETVMELRKRLEQGIKLFEVKLAGAIQALQRSAQARNSLPFLSEARKAMKNLGTIVLGMRDLEKRLLHILKEEKALLDKEKKVA